MTDGKSEQAPGPGGGGGGEGAEPNRKPWRAGETFFEESGGRPAEPQGSEERDAGRTGEDSDVHLPASEADTAPLTHETEGETQSWPGKSFATIPPPG